MLIQGLTPLQLAVAVEQMPLETPHHLPIWLLPKVEMVEQLSVVAHQFSLAELAAVFILAGKCFPVAVVVVELAQLVAMEITKGHHS
jgi:hypothetical protein